MTPPDNRQTDADPLATLDSSSEASAGGSSLAAGLICGGGRGGERQPSWSAASLAAPATVGPGWPPGWSAGAALSGHSTFLVRLRPASDKLGLNFLPLILVSH